MRILHKDLKKGEVKLLTENPDDLWYLSHLIDPQDIVRGKAERKIKLGKEGEKQKVSRRQFTVVIAVDKIEYGKDLVRLNGKIMDGPEDVPRGSYQAIDIGIGSTVMVTKKQWLRYHLDRLDESQKSTRPSILICVHDREDAIFALFRRDTVEVLSELSGQPQKKEKESKASGDFYGDVVRILDQYRERYGLEHILLASPGFFKEDLMKRVAHPLKKIITLATCSSVSKNAINEVLKRDEVKQVLKEDRMTQESLLVEELLEEIGKRGKATYGLGQVEQATRRGAVETLLVTDTLIRTSREEDTYAVLDGLMKLTEQNKGKVRIISTEHETGKQLQGLGGIGALLRYRAEDLA
ncbi:MAG: mRNA surveillance protein pelota [DPANN group archaeon]|nr:mRNA surveillance protein pelota [DPANN group archaeon]